MTQRLIILITLLCTFAVLAFAQTNFGVTAEAVGTANLRSTTSVDGDLLREIASGTQYPVVGRSEFFPWVLLGDRDTNAPIGWVFQDLVVVRGDIFQVPLSDIIVSPAEQQPTLAPTATLGIATNTDPLATPSATLALSPTPLPSPTLAAAVTGTVQGETNVRYGPGVDYPRVAVINAGEVYPIVAYHTQFGWVQLQIPEAPNGIGWVARDLLVIRGDVFSTTAISQTNFALPTLTPTPQVLVQSSLLVDEPVALRPEFEDLGNRLWNYVLANNFDPLTSRFGALFLMDLQTGEAMTFGENIAFSGMSVNKISILAKLYGSLSTPPTERVATDIANTMICSENVATNRLLEVIGTGDQWAGAAITTDFLRQLGLEHTFLTAPFVTDPANPPTPPYPIEYPQTEADQGKANPDPSNQMTVDEMGWLLASMYQCGYQESGPLIDDFDGLYEPRECRQMLHVMRNNTVDALLKAGVPSNVDVSHKHGWIPDTHGNAGVFFTPGGDFVMVMNLFQPEWLNFEESLPVIAETARLVYNFYNPTAPLEEVREGFIPEAGTCNFGGTQLVQDLRQPVWDE